MLSKQSNTPLFQEKKKQSISYYKQFRLNLLSYCRLKHSFHRIKIKARIIPPHVRRLAVVVEELATFTEGVTEATRTLWTYGLIN